MSQRLHVPVLGHDALTFPEHRFLMERGTHEHGSLTGKKKSKPVQTVFLQAVRATVALTTSQINMMPAWTPNRNTAP